jgi:hypothetical protein
MCSHVVDSVLCVDVKVWQASFRAVLGEESFIAHRGRTYDDGFEGRHPAESRVVMLVESLMRLFAELRNLSLQLVCAPSVG